METPTVSSSPVAVPATVAPKPGEGGLVTKPDPAAAGSAKVAQGPNLAQRAKPAATKYVRPQKPPRAAKNSSTHKFIRKLRGNGETVSASIAAHPTLTAEEKAFITAKIAQTGYAYNNVDVHVMTTKKSETIALTIADLS